MAEERILLFLDDEPNILKALRRIFFEDEYIIETFENGEDALDFLEMNDVELIISDQRMPEMTGTEFLAKARELKPDVIRIILTGYADLDAAVDAINDGQIYKFIFKPWNDEELRSTVHRALEFYDLERENERLMAEIMQKNAELEEWNKKLGQKVKERTSLIVQKNLELGRLNKSLETSLISTVKVFVNLMELIDPEVSAHARRVTSFATTVAEQYGLAVDQIQDIEIAALLHDIGKLGIPTAILEKAEETRSENEKELVRNHPILGQNTINDIEKFGRVGKIIRAHHERWDGKGFPDGLIGEEIPVEARLLTACNVYDHLIQEGTTGRSQAFILKFFTTNAGTMIDPAIAEQMIRFIHHQTAEAEQTRQANVMPHELKEGMVLAQNLQTEKGIFLLPEGQMLKDSHIRSILDIHKVDPVASPITVLITNKE